MSFTVTLEKEDIIALLKGTEPPIQLINFFVDKECGNMFGGHNIEWKWNKYGMEKHSEAELYGMYLACKKIKKLEENNEETEWYVQKLLNEKEDIIYNHKEYVEFLKDNLDEYINEGKTAVKAVNETTYDAAKPMGSNLINQFIGYQVFVNVLEEHGETDNSVYKLCIDAVNTLKNHIDSSKLKELQVLLEVNESK